MTIGMFDSGVGGLNLAHAVSTRLPDADMIYFGDTAHLPYGEKSTEAIIHYSTRIAQYLLSRGCQTLVIACNSASAAATQHLRGIMPDDINVIDVISPVVESLAQHYRNKRVGILATQATTDSQQYPQQPLMQFLVL